MDCSGNLRVFICSLKLSSEDQQLFSECSENWRFCGIAFTLTGKHRTSQGLAHLCPEGRLGEWHCSSTSVHHVHPGPQLSSQSPFWWTLLDKSVFLFHDLPSVLSDVVISFLLAQYSENYHKLGIAGSHRCYVSSIPTPLRRTFPFGKGVWQDIIR